MTYPYAYFDLDESLKEISALTTVSNDPSVVASLQDEEGKIYMIDKKRVKSLRPFFS
ncbi:MAG: hypothetical protein HC817_10430 [Saprospiraceae bacterium]|nr:hypothetical protein [Saprospiraceae bacterium]